MEVDLTSTGINIIDRLYNFTDRNSSYVLNDTGSLVTNATTPPNHVNLLTLLPGPIICCFGIMCNVLNLCVLCQAELKDSPYSYLTALAISDLSLLVLSLVHLLITPFTLFQAIYDAHIFFVIGNVFFNTSVWLVVALTIERMFFVIRPLTTHSSRKKAWIYSAIILILCVTINIPRFFIFTVTEYKGTYFPQGTAFRGSGLFFAICWFHAVMINFVPVIILIVTNSVLIHALRLSAQNRKSLRSNREEANQKDQQRLTRTLVIVVVVFFICTIPSAFVDDPIAYALFGKGRAWLEFISSPANHLLINISNILLFLNSSLNFTLYCAFNLRFRRVAKRLFWRVKSRGKSVLLRLTDQSSMQATYSVNTRTTTGSSATKSTEY